MITDTVANLVTTDNLPLTVPKLDVNGVNWAIFQPRFQAAVEAKGLWKQFDGSNVEPVVASESQTPPTAEAMAELTKWKKDESSANNFLIQKIPD